MDMSPYERHLRNYNGRLLGPGFERFVHVRKSAGGICIQHRNDERDEKPGEVLVLDKETVTNTPGLYLKDMLPVKEPANEKMTCPPEFPFRDNIQDYGVDFHAKASRRL